MKGREEDHPWEDLRQRPVTGEWVRTHVLVCIGEGDDALCCCFEGLSLARAFKPKDGLD